MAEALSKTLTHGDFDSVFQEVPQPETVGWTTEGELRLFHLVIRNNKINVEDLKAYLYTSMGDYVFSRARLEKFSQAGNRDAVVSQALRVLKKNGGADVQGTGGELGEVLNYTFMEEKLHAPKLMSRVEISTDGKQYDSVADSIHLLTSGVSGRPYHQVVFGSSNIVGDLGYAIDGAFEKICRIEQHEVQEIHMANQLIFERMATDEEAALVRDILVPNPSKTNRYNTSYGVFLGYTLGLGKDYPVHEYEELAEQKMQADIKRYIPYILQKIQDCGLGMHSFYIYVLPFNDAEDEKKKLGDAIFVDIDSNEYLNEIHEKILFNYALRLFQLETKGKAKEFDLLDALRFADLLSKSNHPESSVSHKMWAQEIIVLLNELYPENSLVKLYAGSVFSSVGNHRGLQKINADYKDVSTFERVFAQYRSDYLTIPADTEKKFFIEQKIAYDHLTDPCFSYSGPTSMGKSFIMRMFIKDEVVLQGAQKNYALIVPTKALINEVRSSVINDLNDNLEKRNYRVVTAASDIALEEEHNYIFVLTPERLLYLLISRPELQIDYLFLDEAHKLSGKNSRGPFYYKVVDMLLKRPKRPHFIFASPNIPNPQVYLRLMNDVIENDDESKLASTYSPVIQVKFLLDLLGQKVGVYNEHTQEVIKVADIKAANISLKTMLLYFEAKNMRLPEVKRSQTIVYYNGRSKAIAAARDFADAPGVQEKHDPELDALSRDITREVHGDYYLAGMIKKGVAYHIGYLPASIRTRIETLFQSGKITTMFCTSTLLEGVNLPADNLFITDNKIFRSEMSPVDFRNLIGRVGRISYNLYGNVFFVSEEKSVKPEDYIEMLQTPVPEQDLSITTNPKVLKKVEKQYVVDILKSGSSVIPQRVNAEGEALQSEESYVMMRKFGLILLRDIMEDRDSLVRREFSDLLSVADENDIRAKFSDSPTLPDDDINTSVDQTKRLIKAIRDGLEYPPCINGSFRYADVIEFLNKLATIFEWDTYEKSSLGKESLRRWYAVILCQWMEGTGLSFIMKKAIEYRRDHPENFYISAYQPPTIYNDRSKEHRNIVFAETLEVIENIILFSISNYFLRFSNEYKKIHNVAEFDNNWYEYVEFGTTNPLTILLQRNGFSREAATFIREHREFVEEDGSTGRLRLKNELLTCGNTSVEMEAADIKYNVPGLFTDDEDDPDNWRLSLSRTIECPDCGIEFEVDLEEYLQDVSSFEKENGMGPDAVYSFDSGADCECPYCGKTIHITGWIREYPIGILDSEEIDVDLFEDEE